MPSVGGWSFAEKVVRFWVLDHAARPELIALLMIDANLGQDLIGVGAYTRWRRLHCRAILIGDERA